MNRQRNIRLLIAFDGTHYNGWQRQRHDITIQGEIERCLARMTNGEVALNGAGRTDAGVHAEGMVANFLTSSQISCSDLQKGLNSMLPDAIRILNIDTAEADFHARFSARGKHYEYTIYTGQIMPPLKRLYALHVPFPLDFIEISQCLNILIGTHDFTTFENSGSRDKSKESRKGAIRTLHEARFDSVGEDYHVLTIIGEGFLRQMVRNIVGTLLEVGKGRRSAAEFHTALCAKDRNAGGATAPPHGLKLKKVLY